MRRISTTIAIFFIAIAVQAQTGDFKFNRQTLSDFLRNYNYIKAHETAIELLKFEEVNTDAYSWFYAGNTYLHIYRLAHYMDFVQPGMNMATATAKMGREPNRIKKDKKVADSEMWYYYYDNIEGVKSLIFAVTFTGGVITKVDMPDGTNYPTLGVGALQKSYEYYQKALAIDPNAVNPMLAPTNASDGMSVVAGQFYNEGVLYYNEKKYLDAANAFKSASEITEKYTRAIDTLATENAAISARLAEDNIMALGLYQKLLSIGYKKSIVYLNLGELCKAMGDTAKAIDYIGQGRMLFPDDFDLLIAQTNLFLNTHRVKEAQDNLMLAVAKDPDNANLYYVIGTQYFDNLKTLDYNTDTATYGHNFSLASDYLTKATELEPGYFEALYNLGALYVNEGVRIFEIAESLEYPKEKKKYDELKIVFESHWVKAQGYMERAHEVNPKDIDTLQSMRQLYARSSNVEKVQEVDQKLKDLGVKK